MSDRVYIVRDLLEDGSGLAPWVYVWSVKPKRWPIGAGFTWSGESWGDPLLGFLGSLWLADACRMFGTVPDDDRQMIVVERDPARVQATITAVNAPRRAGG